MHFADVTKSQRLQRTLSALKKAGRRGVTSRELAEVRGSVAVGTDVSELRAQGHEIECFYSHQTGNGSKIYVYVLDPSGAVR